MAGKVDNATHAAALAKISGAVKHEVELRSHLDEIIRGVPSKDSHRSQAFLTHIIEPALHGDAADLRERSIGVALFGRPATYATADDAMVRAFGAQFGLSGCFEIYSEEGIHVSQNGAADRAAARGFVGHCLPCPSGARRHFRSRNGSNRGLGSAGE